MQIATTRRGPSQIASLQKTAFARHATWRVQAIMYCSPLDMSTMIGAQASQARLGKILSYMDIGRWEDAQLLTGDDRAKLSGYLESGCVMFSLDNGAEQWFLVRRTCLVTRNANSLGADPLDAVQRC